MESEGKGEIHKRLCSRGSVLPALQTCSGAGERRGPGSPGAPGGCWPPSALGAFPSPPPSATPLEFQNMEFPQELCQAELAALPGSRSGIRGALPAESTDPAATQRCAKLSSRGSLSVKAQSVGGGRPPCPASCRDHCALGPEPSQCAGPGRESPRRSSPSGQAGCRLPARAGVWFCFKAALHAGAAAAAAARVVVCVCVSVCIYVSVCCLVFNCQPDTT